MQKFMKNSAVVKTLLLSLIFVGTSFLLSNLYAQVTIGSRGVPGVGAILDLKQEGETIKGLGLPRVKLKHLTIPRGETSLSTTIVDASGDWGAEQHTGLMVYNVGEVCDFFTFPSGPYVWDGKEWQPLSSEGRSTDVGVFFDERGEGATYHYRKFGEAGIWMLENLRFIPEGEGYEDYVASYEMSGDPEVDYIRKQYGYPNAEANPGQQPENWVPKEGLLYTYSAATAGEQDNVIASQGEGQSVDDKGVSNPDGDPNLKIQGLCPDGWHIPNDYEWNKLEKEIYNEAIRYSKYTTSSGYPFTPSSWQDEWNYMAEYPRGATGIRAPGHGLAMQSQCLPLSANREYQSLGESLSAEQGGFDVLLVGMAAGVVEGYGFNASFWTSSLEGGDFSEPFETSAWARQFTQERGLAGEPLYQFQQVTRSPIPGRMGMLSVRCVKD